MGAIDVWAQITTERMAKRPWMQTLLRWTKQEDGRGLQTPRSTLDAMDDAGVDIALLSAWHGPEGDLITNEEVARQLTLSWGVVPALLEPITSTDELIAHAFATVKGTGIAKDGDQVVITAGIPFGGGGMTNLLLVQQIA